MTRSRILLAAVVLFAGCRERTGPTTPAPSPAVDRLLGLMQRRLAVMHDVARWKWANEVPISDPAREAKVLDAVAERGRERGLDPAFVRSFFAAQMEASKRVQGADFDRWRTAGQGPAPGGPDLAASRARIDGLDGEILDALAALGRPPRDIVDRRAGEILAGPGIDEDVRAQAIGPLR